MTHILRNHHLEIHIDPPLDGYNFSRFDWTGKIVKVLFQNRPVSTHERMDGENAHQLGQGFYNEFGIDLGLGFAEAKIGGWFHKIGVGLLKKEDEHYLFSKPYQIEPAQFEVHSAPEKVSIVCTSTAVLGYAYVLRKEIALLESGFTITYQLENCGDRLIATDEYTHNFVALDEALVGEDYLLKFPFRLRPERETAVNPEQIVTLDQRTVSFKRTPPEQFFFSNLTGGDTVDGTWELINQKSQIGISETLSGQTSKVNLWGWRHVISPELFVHLSIPVGETAVWSRTYQISTLV